MITRLILFFSIEMSIEKILWNFSGIVYYNYLKTLIFTIENVDTMWTPHYAAIVRAYLDWEYNGELDMYPSHSLHDVLI